MINAGVTEVVYDRLYGGDEGVRRLVAAGLKVRRSPTTEVSHPVGSAPD